MNVSDWNKMATGEMSSSQWDQLINETDKKDMAAILEYLAGYFRQELPAKEPTSVERNTPWAIEIYRAGSLSTIVIERVKHCWLDGGNTVLRVAQYDAGASGPHHYMTFPLAMIDWWRESRSPRSSPSPAP